MILVLFEQLSNQQPCANPSASCLFVLYRVCPGFMLFIEFPALFLEAVPGDEVWSNLAQPAAGLHYHSYSLNKWKQLGN